MTEIIGTYDTTGSPALSVEQDIALLRNRLESTRAIARTAIRRIDELEGRVTVMAELLPGTPPANDELWRLARDWERYATDNPHAEVELRAFVRGRRP